MKWKRFEMASVRSEPLSLQEIEQTVKYSNSLALLQESRFLPFLQKFDKINMGVVLEFATTFKEGRVSVRSSKFEMNEEFISRATCLPLTGESSFKKEKLTKKHWKQFVVDKKIEVDLKKGLPQPTIIGKWQDLLFLLQTFVTSEGRYTLAFIYHFRLLSSFEAGKLISFPHFLLRGLENMVKNVQSGSVTRVAAKLCHHALIMMLVKKKLEKKGIAREAFLKEF